MMSTIFDDGRKCIFMASEVRSGSTFVGESFAYELKRNFDFELWQLTAEAFSFLDQSTTPSQLLDTWSKLHFDMSGFVAAKILCHGLSHIHRLARISCDVKDAFFGSRARWIVVRRRDRVGQAISLALARKTQSYHFYDNPELAADAHADVSLDEIDAALKALALSDIYLETFAATLRPDRSLTIFYESFVEDQVNQLLKVHKICGFPGFDPASFVNESKIKQTGASIKKAYSAQFSNWLLANNG